MVFGIVLHEYSLYLPDFKRLNPNILIPLIKLSRIKLAYIFQRTAKLIRDEFFKYSSIETFKN